MTSEQRPNPEQHVSVRVPDSIGPGVFASAAVVMAAPQELVLDFLQTLVQPSQLVARVIIPWGTVPQLTAALRQNLDKHGARFGGKQEFPMEVEPEESSEQPEEEFESEATGGGSSSPDSGSSQQTGDSPSGPSKGTRQVQAQSFYDDLRINDDLLRGNYANGAMINHTEFEFKLDFLATLAPHPVVTARVFLSAPQAHRLLESIEDNEKRRRGY